MGVDLDSVSAQMHIVVHSLISSSFDVVMEHDGKMPRQEWAKTPRRRPWRRCDSSWLFSRYRGSLLVSFFFLNYLGYLINRYSPWRQLDKDLLLFLISLVSDDPKSTEHHQKNIINLSGAWRTINYDALNTHDAAVKMSVLAHPPHRSREYMSQVDWSLKPHVIKTKVSTDLLGSFTFLQLLHATLERGGVSIKDQTVKRVSTIGPTENS